MRMELVGNFSAEIWGDFYNPDYPLDHEKRPIVPTTIAMAIYRFRTDEDREDEWQDMAEEIAPKWCDHQDPFMLPASVIWDKIKETNTVESGSKYMPLKVWIDENGNHTLEVYGESFAKLLEFNLQGLRVLDGVIRLRDALQHYQRTSDHRSLRIEESDIAALRKTVVFLAAAVDVLEGDTGNTLEAICSNVEPGDATAEIDWYAAFSGEPQ